MDQQVRGGVIILAAVIGPDHEEEVGMLLYNESKEEYGIQVIYLSTSLNFLPTFMVTGEVHPPWPGTGIVTIHL